MIAALKAAGVTFVSDINADQRYGHAIAQTYAFNGRRSFTAKPYLALAKDRPNLHVIKHARVEKVLINSNNVAYCVEFVFKDKQKLKAYAKKEVIVSAGAVHSVALLMRSGIGPKSYLDQLGIKCKADLPVSDNFMNHVYLSFFFSLNISTTPVPTTAALDSIYQYATRKSGPLGAFSTLLAFLNTTNPNGYYNTTTTAVNATPDIEQY